MSNHFDRQAAVWDRRRILFPVLLVLVLWTVSSIHVSPQIPGGGFAGLDKILHFAVYGLLATTLFRVRIRAVNIRWVLITITLTAALGMTEEFLQSLNPYRTFEWKDFFADTSGAIVAVISYRLLPLYRHVLERRLWGNPLTKSTDSLEN